MARRTPVPPLQPGWVIVDGLPVFHRVCLDAGPTADTIVHVHGFGISGTYLEPTAALLAARHNTYVPDLPGMGRSMRPHKALDLPGLARSLASYCAVMGIERATFVGNSLGCPIILELAATFPELVERAVVVSPAGGPNNQPLPRAIRQIALDGLREPPSMAPIAVRDYLRFGVLQGLALFGAMTRYPTLERLHLLEAPTLAVVGERDPLVRLDRAQVLTAVPHVTVVKVPGAHALNYSAPELVAALVEAHITGGALTATTGPLRAVEVLDLGAGH